MARVSKTVNLDVVELLKQVLQWTPLYKPGLNTALLQAAKVGSAGCIKVLLSAGAEVDAEDENGDTPFVHAFRGHHTEVMELLHEGGCTTEIAKMSLALATKDVGFVKFCYGLDIPVENEDWNCADEEEVEILLQELKIDPFIGQYGNHGYEDSPFMYLAQEGKPEIIKLVVEMHPCLDEYSAEDKKTKMNEALHRSIKYRRLDNVKVLLNDLGASLEAMDTQGRNAFTAACEHEENIAQFFLDKGASIFNADHEGLTSLHWSACVGFTKLSAQLIEKGSSVNAKAKLGATPLMVACSGGHLDIAQQLVENGGNVNTVTPEGFTALHVATWACSPAVVKLLLDTGALPDVVSSKLAHNGDTVPATTPLLIAICLDSVKILHHLMDANCDINMKGLVFMGQEEDTEVETNTFSPIQYAVVSRSWDIADILLHCGCDYKSLEPWLEDEKVAPVQIPRERKFHFKHLVNVAKTNPPCLKDLARRNIRKFLGYHLLPKVEQLGLTPAAKNFLLLHDLFNQPTGESSFEV